MFTRNLSLVLDCCLDLSVLGPMKTGKIDIRGKGIIVSPVKLLALQNRKSFNHKRMGIM